MSYRHSPRVERVAAKVRQTASMWMSQVRVEQSPDAADDLVERVLSAIIPELVEERASIVEWLRNRGDRLCLDCCCYSFAADDIEAGAFEEGER